MAFLDSLRDASLKAKLAFEGGSPAVEKGVAASLSPLYSTFGPFMDSMPHRSANAVRANFSDNVLKISELKRAIASELGTGVLSDKDLMDEAVKAGIFSRGAEDKNTLYQVNKGSDRLRSAISRASDSMDLGGQVDEYLDYISDLNFNVAERGLKVSPNRALTHEGFQNRQKSYLINNRSNPNSVWNTSSKRNIVSFDLETAGGKANAADVNEVFALNVSTNPNGGITVGSSARETFSVNRMTLGTFRDNFGKAQSLNLKFAPAAGSAAENMFTKVAGDGAEFAKKMQPILEQMANADAILGQNIMGFDIDRLIGNVVRTSEYQNGGPIKGVVDQVMAKVKTEGYVIDTLQMIGEYERSQNVNLARSPMLPKGTGPRSIQNILLNTNLADLMGANVDESKVTGLWKEAISGGGHHTGRFDTIVTSAFYDAMVTGKLKLNEASQGLSKRALKDIVSSKAYTSMSTITNPDDILHDTYKTLRAVGERDPRALRALSVAGDRPAMTLQNSSYDQVMAAIDSDDYYLDTSMSYLDQTSIHTRNLHKYTDTTDSVATAREAIVREGDAWRHLTGMDSSYNGTLNAGGSIFKHGVGFDLDKFAQYQDSISELPFSHIGLPERYVSMAASIGSQSGKTSIVESIFPNATKTAAFAEDMGTSFFTTDLKGQTFRQSHSTLETTLDKALRMNSLAGGNLFGEDFAEGGLQRLQLNVGRTNKGTAFANVQLEVAKDVLDEDTIQKIRYGLQSDGIDESEIDNLIDKFFSLSSGDDPMRITVGSMEGSGAEMIADAIGSVKYELHHDKPIYMPLIEHGEHQAGSRRLIGSTHVGPAMIGDIYTDAEKAGIRADVGRARDLSEDMRADATSSQAIKAGRRKQRTNRGKRGGPPSLDEQIADDWGVYQYRQFKESIGDTAETLYAKGGEFLASKKLFSSSADNAAKFLKRATLPSLVGGALGLYAVKKRNDTSVYDETFEMGNTNVNGYYSEGDFSSSDPIHKRVRPRVSPLATANTVFDAYENRIGHTRPPGRTY